MPNPKPHQPLHTLRLLLSCRKLTAQVTDPKTHSIIAIASSTEQEFVRHMRSKLNQLPRSHNFWGPKIASRVGEKLGDRLIEIGVSGVRIDLEEEMGRKGYYRKMVGCLFKALERCGVGVEGAEKLQVQG
ncbi:hypothetical protein Droror1_Dr00012178 [Drosera rotundifolia]